MKIVLLLLVISAVAFGTSGKLRKSKLLTFLDSDPNLISICDATSERYGCDPQYWVGGDRLQVKKNNLAY
jgi:hypothetical protein